jgi:hypothetical protein
MRSNNGIFDIKALIVVFPNVCNRSHSAIDMGIEQLNKRFFTEDGGESSLQSSLERHTYGKWTFKKSNQKIIFARDVGITSFPCKWDVQFPDGSKYIGSTKALLSVRLNGHIQDYKRVKKGKSKRVFPLLHAKFDEFQNIDDLVHHVKNNTSIIEECVGSKTKQYTLEATWIKRLQKKGETLLNKSLPRRYENIKI